MRSPDWFLDARAPASARSGCAARCARARRANAGRRRGGDHDGTTGSGDLDEAGAAEGLGCLLATEARAVARPPEDPAHRPKVMAKQEDWGREERRGGVALEGATAHLASELHVLAPAGTACREVHSRRSLYLRVCRAMRISHGSTARGNDTCWDTKSAARATRSFSASASSGSGSSATSHAAAASSPTRVRLPTRTLCRPSWWLAQKDARRHPERPIRCSSDVIGLRIITTTLIASLTTSSRTVSDTPRASPRPLRVRSRSAR
jgi:hypothetical protein